MGSLQASAFAEQVSEGAIDIDFALSWHLSSNHYPPVPSVFLPTCKAAIVAVEGFEPYQLVELPDGIEWKDGRAEVEAWRIVESFHLDAFIDYDESEEEVDA